MLSHTSIQNVSGEKVNILGGHSTELFHCTVQQVLMRKRYYILQFLFKWLNWYSLPSITHFRKFHVKFNALCNSCEDMACCSSECIFTFFYAGDNIHSSIWETVRSRIHVHIDFFCLEWPILWPPRIFRRICSKQELWRQRNSPYTRSRVTRHVSCDVTQQ
jgi:hypothetical protein